MTSAAIAVMAALSPLAMESEQQPPVIDLDVRQALDESRLGLVFECLLRRGYPFWLENPGLFLKHAKLVYGLLERTEHHLEHPASANGGDVQ